MNKKMLIVLLPIFLLACNFLFPSEETSTPTETVLTKTKIPQETERSEYNGFTIVRLHPGDGDLQALLAAEAQKAASQGLMPVVEFDATWCPPCQAIDAALKEKNELMVKAYEGTYIIKLDVDEWVWDDGRVQNFAFDGIPVYFKLDADGKQTGEVIDGNAWGDNIPENMAPPMDKFFHGE